MSELVAALRARPTTLRAVSRTIRLAFSPDADDAFMFYALLAGHISHPGYHFVARRADTEALNRAAAGDDPDEVIAISIAHYPRVAERYLLLPHGGSVGVGYGPVVVAPSPPPGDALAALAGRKVALPGVRTTAATVLTLLAREAAIAYEPVEVPIVPHEAIFDALARGRVDVALLIHEGRLTYAQRGLALWLDLGAEWLARTGHALPLGGNAIRRDLGLAAITEISSLLRESIQWALAHRDTVIEALAREKGPLDRAGLDRYLALYANTDTLDYGPAGRAAITALLSRAARAGLLPDVTLEFAP